MVAYQKKGNFYFQTFHSKKAFNKSQYMVDIGKNVSAIRAMKQIPQKAMAAMLHITQQEYSRIERSSEIEDDILQKIANELNVPVEAFKEADLENKVQTVFQTNTNDGNVIAIQINPVEKIIELYEKMLTDKNQQLAEAKERIQELEKKLFS
jgi:transcriptional regulator with XRE-family HTH domain